MKCSIKALRNPAVALLICALSSLASTGQAAVSCGSSKVDDRAEIFAVLNNPAALRDLLNKGADPNVRSAMIPTLRDCIGPPPDIGDRPVFRAAYLGYPEAVQMLLDAGALIDVEGPRSNILLYATKNKRNKKSLQIVKQVLDHSPDLTEHAAPALVLAIRNQDRALFDALLDKTVAVNTPFVPPWSGSDTLPLTTAAQDSDIYAVKALLAHGANPNLRPNKGSTALIAATVYAKYLGSPDFEPTAVEIVDLLLAHGAKVDCTGSLFSLSGDNNSALKSAVYRRSVPLIQRLLAANPGQQTLTDALELAKRNVNGVKPIDATIIGLIEAALPNAPAASPAECPVAAPAKR